MLPLKLSPRPNVPNVGYRKGGCNIKRAQQWEEVQTTAAMVKPTCRLKNCCISCDLVQCQQVNLRKQNKVYCIQINLENMALVKQKQAFFCLVNPTGTLQVFNMLIYSDSPRGEYI